MRFGSSASEYRPRQLGLTRFADLPPPDPGRRNLEHPAAALAACFKLRMTKKVPNQAGRLDDRRLNHDQRIVPMTQTDAEESKVSGKERGLLGLVQKSKDLLLVVPLRSSDLKPDLPNVNAPSRELSYLVFGEL
jgi:hypothetical protein